MIVDSTLTLGEPSKLIGRVSLGQKCLETGNSASCLGSHLINRASMCSHLLHSVPPVSDVIIDASVKGMTVFSPESGLMSDLHIPARTHHHLCDVSWWKITSPLTRATSFFLRCQNVLNSAGSCLISRQPRALIQMPRGPEARYGGGVCKLWHIRVKNFFLTQKGWWMPGHPCCTLPEVSLFSTLKANDSSGVMLSHSVIFFFLFSSLISCPHATVSWSDGWFWSRYELKDTV